MKKHISLPPSPRKYGIFKNFVSLCSRLAPDSAPYHHLKPASVLDASGVTHTVQRACCSNFRNPDASDMNAVKLKGSLVREGEEGCEADYVAVDAVYGNAALWHLAPLLVVDAVSCF